MLPCGTLRMKIALRETAARAEEVRVAEAAKTARLRALRLAKDSADRDVAQDAEPTPHGDGSSQPRRAGAIIKPAAPTDCTSGPPNSLPDRLPRV